MRRLKGRFNPSVKRKFETALGYIIIFSIMLFLFIILGILRWLVGAWG